MLAAGSIYSLLRQVSARVKEQSLVHHGKREGLCSQTMYKVKRSDSAHFVHRGHNWYFGSSNTRPCQDKVRATSCRITLPHRTSICEIRLFEGRTSPIQRSLARRPNAVSATLSYVEPPDLREQDTRVNTVKSVATAVSTSKTAPKTIPLLLSAKGSDRTPPPGSDKI